MKRKSFDTVAAATVVALVVLLFGVYPFTFPNANFAKGQVQMTMGPPMSPTTQPTTTPSPGANNQAFTFVLLAIAIVLITLVALVVYVIYLKNKKRGLAPHVYKSRSTEGSTFQSGLSLSKEEAKPFLVFLSYKKSSGKDYADHLKAGLEEVGLHTFEDCKDIPLAVNTEEGWARVRDQALTESKYFVLIMTQGFDLSAEVIKEIRMARKQANKSFVFFRQRSMSRKIIINLGDEVFDISQLEQVSFESKEELLRLAINILQSGNT